MSFEHCSMTGVGEIPLVRLSGRPAPRFEHSSADEPARDDGGPYATDPGYDEYDRR
jgi:hypothetical protein